MARFKTGSPKRGGRKQGTPNKTTAEAREVFNSILCDEVNNIRAALAKVRVKDSYKYLDLMSKLLAYVLPKAQVIDMSVDFNQLSEQDIDTIIDKLFKQQDNG